MELLGENFPTTLAFLDISLLSIIFILAFTLIPFNAKALFQLPDFHFKPWSNWPVCANRYEVTLLYILISFFLDVFSIIRSIRGFHTESWQLTPPRESSVKTFTLTWLWGFQYTAQMKPITPPDLVPLNLPRNIPRISVKIFLEICKYKVQIVFLAKYLYCNCLKITMASLVSCPGLIVNWTIFILELVDNFVNFFEDVICWKRFSWFPLYKAFPFPK